MFAAVVRQSLVLIIVEICAGLALAKCLGLNCCMKLDLQVMIFYNRLIN